MITNLACNMYVYICVLKVCFFIGWQPSMWETFVGYEYSRWPWSADKVDRDFFRRLAARAVLGVREFCDRRFSSDCVCVCVCMLELNEKIVYERVDKKKKIIRKTFYEPQKRT